MTACLEAIKESLAMVRYPLATAMTLPPACYHASDWMQVERDAIFRTGWLCLGRRDNWSGPGAFEAFDVAGMAVVVVADEQGTLHALANSCLHRGSQIAVGKGHCKSLVCPFHGWCYDYRGQLLAAPRMEAATNFCATDMRLKSFAVAESEGFVFVNPSHNPEPLEHWLEDFSELHAPWSLGSLVTTRRRCFTVACNWKLFLEVFNEYYHLPCVHGKSINDYYIEPDPAEPVMGQYTTQFGRTTANPALLQSAQARSLPPISGIEGREAQGVRYTWVYPNLTFAASFDCIWGYHVLPLTPGSCRVEQIVCFPEPTVASRDFEDKAKDYYHRFDRAIEEDIVALERQQHGLASPCATQGRFSALEVSVGNFACWYAEQFRPSEQAKKSCSGFS